MIECREHLNERDVRGIPEPLLYEFTQLLDFACHEISLGALLPNGRTGRSGYTSNAAPWRMGCKPLIRLELMQARSGKQADV
jgi:hypothetical protein